MERLRAISSRQNATVKQLRRAFSQGELTADGLCAIEGVRLIEEAIRSGLRVQAIVFSDSGRSRSERLLPQISGRAEALLVPDEVFRSAVSTEAPQGVAALVKARTFRMDDLFRGPENIISPLIAVAAGVQDPGNLGTIARSAEAFGASGLLLTEGTVAPFNAKAVRSSAGSLFRLPILRTESAAAVSLLRERGVRLVGATSHKGTPLDECDLTGALAIFVGNEGAGLSRELSAHMDTWTTVPQSARVESLNAGVAASILLYEAARQRRART